jgi:hypothetical protein
MMFEMKKPGIEPGLEVPEILSGGFLWVRIGAKSALLKGFLRVLRGRAGG